MNSFVRCQSMFIIFSTIFFSHLSANPIKNNTPYDQFINFLVTYHCQMPKEIEFPLSSDDPSPFSYLSEPLKECQTSDASNEVEEAKFLCGEIFDALQNITCAENNYTLPKIKKIPFSQNVCTDFKAIQDTLPKRNEYLSGKLADDTLCKIMCTRNYELLCKTLLWSHAVQAAIKNATANNTKEKEVTNVGQSFASKTGSTSIKVSLADGVSELDKQKSNGAEKDLKNDNMVAENKNILQDDTNLNPKNENVSDSKVVGAVVSDQAPAVKTDANGKSHSEAAIKSNVTSNNLASKSEPATENQKLANNGAIQPDKSNQNPPLKVDNPSQSAITSSAGKEAGKESNKSSMNAADNAGPAETNNVPANDVASANGADKSPANNVANTSSSTSDSNLANSENKPQSVKDENANNVPSNNLSDTEKPKINTGDVGENQNLIPQDNEMDNNLNNVNIEGDEKEGKDKETNIKTDEKEVEPGKPELTDFEAPLSSPDKDMKPIESTTLFIPPEEDSEHQEDKDQDQYNDTENDGDYPKSEYENSFNPPPKNKESIATNSVGESPNQLSNSYETFISSRNNIRQMPDEVQMISSFPEQEDSHFFFYFLSIVLILMAGYLIFHNKQKIIALIVEGRHERRRRSHGGGYKKLETK